MPGCTVELAVVIKRSNIEFSSFFFKSTFFHNYYFRFLCYTYQQEAMGEHHPPVKNWNKLYYHLLLEVNELNRSSDNPRTYILPFEFRNCLVFLPPNHQSLFKNLQKNFLIILLFGGKLLAQKKKRQQKNVFPWTESVKNQITSTPFSYYLPASKICRLIVSAFSAGHFCIYYWVTKLFFSPFF